jgi:hypothetical protein
MTARRAQLLGLHPDRSFGYYIRITPPKITMQEGVDVEGVGYWRWQIPRKLVQNFFGWYKFKTDAYKRASELNGAEKTT